MPSRCAAVAVFALLAVCGTRSSASAVVTIDAAAWLAGCWESSTAARSIEEQWSRPRGGSMLGTGRTVKDGKTVDYEFVRLHEREGRLAYEAHPAGQATTVFLSTDVTGTRLVFEDPAHDFPQRVGYEHTGRDTLLAWIEGTERGQNRRVEFPYHRVACPA